MIAMFATFVFAAAGYFGAVVVWISIRDALPSLRRLRAERQSIEADRVYLFTMIETPRHDSTPAPIPEPFRVRVAPPLGTKLRVRRPGRIAVPAATPAKYPAAA